MGNITSNPVVGNYGDGSSWIGGVAPVDGDIVIIAAGSTISVTDTDTCTIGTSGDSGTVALTIEGGGQLNISGTLRCRGDIRLVSAGLLHGNAGGKIILDSPPGSRYGIKSFYSTLVVGPFTSSGVSWEEGEFFTIDGDGGRGGARGFVDFLQSFTNLTGEFDCKYTKFINLGDADFAAIQWYPFFEHQKFNWENVAVINCGTVDVYNRGLADTSWEFVDFRNPVSEYPYRWLDHGEVTVGSRYISSITVYSEAAKSVMQSTPGLTQDNFILYNTLQDVSLVNDRIASHWFCIIDAGLAGVLPIPPKRNWEITESIFLSHQNNPHISYEIDVDAGPSTGNYHSYNIFDGDGYFDIDTGECTSMGMANTVHHNLAINGAGILVAGSRPLSSMGDVVHNTVVGDRTGLAGVNETESSAASLGVLRNNLMFGSNNAPFNNGAVQQRSFMVPQNRFILDHNASWGNPSTTKAYPVGHPFAGQQSYLDDDSYSEWWAPTQIFGVDNATNDLVVNPYFVNPEWTVRGFFGLPTVRDVAREAVTINGLDYEGNLIAKTTKTPAIILLAGFTAFTPTNSALETAGYGGTYIGAMDVQADPIVTVTAPLQYTGRARYSVTPISNPEDTAINPSHTYKFAQAPELMAAMGWVDGVDHWAFDLNGVPKTVSYETIMSQEFGPKFFAGVNGVVVYSVDQAVTTRQNKVLKPV